MPENELRALYITRKFPPSVGGMQTMNYFLSKELGKEIAVDKIVWGYSQLFLPFFAVKLFLKSMFYLILQRRKYDFVCLGDGMLSCVGVFLKRFISAPVICIAHGLDVTYTRFNYQNRVIPCLKKMDLIVCVSSFTKEECVKRGIEEIKISVVPNGIKTDIVVDKASSREKLIKMGIKISGNTKILLTVGRLVPRKGVAEFIGNVFSALIKDYPNVVYLIVGSGKNKPIIEDKIKRYILGKNVILLGNVSDEVLHEVYSAADIFVMPNIKVPGNIEGFGIAALEASVYGLPVVASDLEGIKDAVKEGINGCLIPCGDYISFKNKIIFFLQNNAAREEFGKKGQEYAKKFSWANIAAQYLKIIKTTIRI